MRRARSKKRTKGSASIEIMVMLPVFIVLFFGVFYLHRAAQSELAVRQEARACAWQFALSGCKRGKGDGLCKNTAPTYEGDVASSQDKSVFGWIAEIPVLSEAVQFVFGEGMSAQAKTTTQAFMSSSTGEKSASTFLICNTVSESWEDKVRNGMCGIANWVLPVKVPGC